MKIFENDYWEYYAYPKNNLGMIRIDHDKKKDEWFLVHASTIKIRAKKDNDIIKSILTFII